MLVLDAYCPPHLNILGLCVSAGNYVGDEQTNCCRLDFKGAACLISDVHFCDCDAKS